MDERRQVVHSGHGALVGDCDATLLTLLGDGEGLESTLDVLLSTGVQLTDLVGEGPYGRLLGRLLRCGSILRFLCQHQRYQ